MALSPYVYLFLFLSFCLFLASKQLLFFWRFRRRQVKLIELIPGPPCLPIIGVAHHFPWRIEEFSLQLLQFARDAHRMGFPLQRLWIGPCPVVFVFQPDSIRAILENSDLLAKGPEYNILKRWLGTGLLTSDGQKWRERRKLLTPAFHFSILAQSLASIWRESMILVECLNCAIKEDGTTIDVGPYLRRCALDIICETAMGVQIGAQLDPANPYLASVQRINRLIFLYSRMPLLWLRPFWQLSGLAAQFNSHLSLLTDFTRKVIARRKAAGMMTAKSGKKSAFLDLLLSLQLERGALSDEDIREEVDTFMFEGHDTTASGMGWTLWCLAYFPECQRRVQEELDAVFGDDAHGRPPTLDQLSLLHYLEKCIREALRLFPPVPMFTRRVDKEFDCEGTLIPAGTTLLLSPFLLHRNPNHFPNPDQFDPDGHFPSLDNGTNDHLADAGHHRPQHHPFAFLPFSAGSRNCIGQKFAMMEEKIVLSTLLRHFWVEPAPDGPAFAENVPCPEVTLKPHRGFRLQIKQRGKQLF